jgi:TPR repeat protein
MYALGMLYEDGKGVPLDTDKAQAWYAMAEKIT